MARTKLDTAVEAAASTFLLALRNMRLGGTREQLIEELDAVHHAAVDALLEARESDEPFYKAPSASVEIMKPTVTPTVRGYLARAAAEARRAGEDAESQAVLDAIARLGIVPPGESP